MYSSESPDVLACWRAILTPCIACPCSWRHPVRSSPHVVLTGPCKTRLERRRQCVGRPAGPCRARRRTWRPAGQHRGLRVRLLIVCIWAVGRCPFNSGSCYVTRRQPVNGGLLCTSCCNSSRQWYSIAWLPHHFWLSVMSGAVCGGLPDGRTRSDSCDGSWMCGATLHCGVIFMAPHEVSSARSMQHGCVKWWHQEGRVRWKNVEERWQIDICRIICLFCR